MPIVEGEGEVLAVPVLVRQWLRHRRYQAHVEVEVPVRAPGSGAIKAAHVEGDDLGVEHYVELAMLRGPDIVLIVVDADDDCPAELGPALLARARKGTPPDFPIGVVVANREYESWFLAAFTSESFRQGLIQRGWSPAPRGRWRGVAVESLRDGKSRVVEWLGLPRYEPTIHQERLTQILPFSPVMARRSRSFGKLLRDLESLMKQARRRRP